jgi:hypothetical protein
MRLLAYGGNASKERRRLGEWDIPEPILQSGYGIGAPNRRSYGCGILQKKPYLIFRELQGTERGGYPFTLLMDPGEEIWRRWQWDAAELIAAILQSEECGVLFREPERLEEASVRQLFSGLSRRESSEKRPLNQDQLSVWIGACAAEQAVIVLPALFGFDSRPTVSDMVSVTSTLPLCFRIGCGWIVAATPAQAQRYGVKLVIDEEADLNPEILKQVIAFGSEAWNAWRSWSKSRPSSEATDHIVRIPAGCWDEPTTRILENVSYIARIRDGSAEHDSLPSIHLMDLSPLLAPELLSLVADELTRQSRKLSSTPTSELIEWALGRGGQIPDRVWSLMDPATILAEFEKRSIQPGAWPPGLALPVAIRAWTFKQALRKSVRRIPNLLEAALSDLEPLSRNEVSELGTIAVNRLPFSTDRLEDWLLLRPRQDVFRILADPLREESRRRMRENVGDWQRDYLIFAADVGAKCFRSDDESSFKAMIRVGKEILTQTNPEDEELRATTRGWFAAIARGSHRKRMAYSLKRRIALEIEGAWKPLKSLDEFLGGTGTDLPQIDEAERRMLRVEVTQYLEWKNGLPTSFPLLRLVQWLNPLPESAVQAILEKIPNFPDGKGVDAWIEGVHLMAGENAARKQRAELIARHPELLGRIRLGDEELANLVRWQLFEEHQNRTLLAKLAASSDHFREILNRAFDEASTAEAKEFARQYEKSQENLQVVIQFASEENLDKVADWLAEHSEGAFVENENESIKKLKSIKPGQRDPWLYALCKLVLRRSGLIRKIANPLDLTERALKDQIEKVVKGRARKS